MFRQLTATAALLGAAIGTQAAFANVGQGPDINAMQGVPVELKQQVRDSFIFVFDESVGRGQVAGQAEDLVRGAGGKATHTYTDSIQGFAARMPAQAAERLAARNPNIAYYVPDGVAFAIGRAEAAGANVQGATVQSTAGTFAQSTPWGITRVGGALSGSGLWTWVIDTGVQGNHPDLNVSSTWSRNFVSGLSSSAWGDGNGHGTHVAGTIAAINNSTGVVGVAAGANVIAVRVLNSAGSGSYSDIIAGVDYVGREGFPSETANMSLGGPANSALDNAVANAAASSGTTFVLAAGNESQFAGNVSPARTNAAGVWTVSASDINDRFASFSNWGNPPIECAAPGVNINSTWIGSGYRSISGTSMAAPHVAGILLANNFQAFSGGPVTGDPDGNPDLICVH